MVNVEIKEKNLASTVCGTSKYHINIQFSVSNKCLYTAVSTKNATNKIITNK